MTDPAGPTFRLGEWLVEPDMNRLSSGSTVRQLEPKTMEVLVYLHGRPGAVVSAEEIIAEVWGGRPMGDNPVYKSIAKLRRALDGDSGESSFVLTVPKKGYKLIRPVDQVTPTPPVAKPEASAPLWQRTAPIAVGLLAGVIIAAAVLWRPASAPTSIRSISTFAGSHSQPSFAPDGKRFAFVNDVEGTPYIWVWDGGEMSPRQVTFSGNGDARPRWSPTGDTILMMRNGGIWSVTATGGEPIELLRDGYNPNWSRDGKRIVFERRYEIWIADADGGNQDRLSGIARPELALTPRWPAFSPDGTRIVFFEAGDTPEGDLWTMEIAAGRPEQLTDAPAFGSAPVWSPEGDEIIYSSLRGGSRTLWSVDPRDGTSRALLGGSGDDDYPDISADGEQIIYSNSRERFVLLQSDVETGSERTLHESRLILVGPELSPDRETIVLFGAAPTGGVQLYTLPASGGPTTMITHDAAASHAIPRWSSDGQSLYFFHTQTETSYARTGATGGTIETVATGWNWNVANGAVIDPSGTRVIYSRLDGQAPIQTMVRYLDSNRDEAFFATLEYPRWSRDGASVVGSLFTNQRFPGDIAVCPVAGDGCRVLAEDARIPMWSADESRVFFVRGFGESQQLFVVDADGTGVERKLMDMEPLLPLGPFYSVTQDDEIIWIRHEKEPGAIWLIDRTSD